MALDMRDSVAFVKDPRPELAEDADAHVKIRLERLIFRVKQESIKKSKEKKPYCFFASFNNVL